MLGFFRPAAAESFRHSSGIAVRKYVVEFAGIQLGRRKLRAFAFRSAQCSRAERRGKRRAQDHPAAFAHTAFEFAEPRYIAETFARNRCDPADTRQLQ